MIQDPKDKTPLTSGPASNEGPKQSDAPPANGNGAESQQKMSKKRSSLVWWATGIFLIAALAFTLYYFLVLQYEQYTDDCYVGCNLVDVTVRIAGTPIAYYCDDTDLVKEGQLLVQIDTTDFALDYEKQKVALALAVQQAKQLWESIQQNIANTASKQALFARAQQDYQNRQPLSESRAVAEEDINHSQDDMTVAGLALKVAQHQLDQSIAALGVSNVLEAPQITQAKLQLKQAYLNLKRCSIYAPCTGYVAKRSVQVGEWITANKPLLSIIPLDQIWVDANFKETQLTWMRIGQTVNLTADMYGSSVKFKGSIVGVQPGTGAVFSLLPPQNATGNWIKIVQRVPVRIHLDPKEFQKHPLLYGFSCEVYVDITDTSGEFLAPLASSGLVHSTNVYDIDMAPVEEEIERILETNLPNPKVN